ncbi:hypothetical protein HGD85_04340, partial [Rhodobacteraceae bacterium R_SAG10]|nr:hypothetical protein [Rhodobacteraceae bacterium R_SAG10]
PECHTVALADISSGTVLCVSAKQKHPQERLDALCSTAAELLDGDAAQAFSKALEMPKTATLQESVVMAKLETYIFLRSPQDRMEAMLCICSANIDIDTFLQGARSSLKTIANAQ